MLQQCAGDFHTGNQQSSASLCDGKSNVSSVTAPGVSSLRHITLYDMASKVAADDTTQHKIQTTLTTHTSGDDTPCRMS